MFKKMKIKTMLMGGFVFLLIFISLSFLVLGSLVYQVNKGTTLFYEHPFTVQQALLHIETNILTIQKNMRDVIIFHDIETKTLLSKEIDESEKVVFSNLEIVQTQYLGDKEQIENLKKLFKEWKPIRESVFLLVSQGDFESAAQTIRTMGQDHVQALLTESSIIMDFASEKANESYENILNLSNKLLYSIFLIYFIFFSILFFFVWTFLRRVLGQIFDLNEGIKLSPKDGKRQEVKLKNQDEIAEIADSFNFLLKDFNEAKQNVEKKIKARTEELESMNDYMVGRELKMYELKKEIMKLKRQVKN